MPREKRQQSSTSIYHVMSRGLNKLAVFRETRERTRLINLIRENLEKYNVEIYAYCIMPNHFHLLIKADLEELASFMAKILAAFAKYYNKKHNRVGYVFQGRYKSQCVENIGYFWNCLRYIHNNFYDFHRQGSWCVFDDIEEESTENKLRIAKEILKELEEVYETKAIEVIDYVELRKQLKEEIKMILHITVRETDEIINKLRKDIVGTS